jgi:hypothetical protein
VVQVEGRLELVAQVGDRQVLRVVDHLALLALAVDQHVDALRGEELRLRLVGEHHLQVVVGKLVGMAPAARPDQYDAQDVRTGRPLFDAPRGLREDLLYAHAQRYLSGGLGVIAY